MRYTINRVKVGDEAALAYIQTESWKAAFRDILSPEALARNTDPVRAEAMYWRLMEQQIGNGYLLRVEGRPHCIAWWDSSREPDMPDHAELICIHSLPDRWRQGFGLRMMKVVLADMAAAGYQWAMLWVFEDNHRARRFYEKCGFSATSRVKDGFGSTEVCYEKRLCEGEEV